MFNGEYSSDEIGCWMRDPKPQGQEDEDKYWLTRMTHNQLLQEFSSKEDFRTKVATRNYSLVHRFSGNSQAVYAGSFYYAEEGAAKLIIFNLKTKDSSFIDLEHILGSPQALPGMPLKSIRHTRSHQHQKRIHSGKSNGQRKKLYTNQINHMDIATDENGVWLVYPNIRSHCNNTVVVKCNRNSVENIWNLTVDYHEIGETFIMCGILYGIRSTNELNTHISFAYDLFQNEELDNVNQISFTNPFQSTQFVSYNSRHKKLYTWDKGNILEYQLKIESTQ